MTPEEIEIPRPLVNQMFQHAQSSPKKEVCGLIASKNGNPTSCYPIKNIASTPQFRFRMDAKEQIQSMKIMRENHQELFAIYHSHPTSVPVPSETDLKEITYPEAMYIIISLNITGVLEMRGFRLTASKKFNPVNLVLKQET